MRRLSPGLSLDQIAGLTDARVVRGSAAQIVDRLASLAAADAGSVAVLSQAKYRPQALVTSAAAVVTAGEWADAVPAGSSLLIVADPYRAYARLARAFDERLRIVRAPRIDPRAHIDASARIDPAASVEAGAVVGPGSRIARGASVGAGAVIGEDSSVGANTVIHPGVILGRDTVLGESCIIHAGTVLGSDGFGFARHEGEWEKIPQLGRVVIGNNVEIGANCSIDRGALDDTIISDGCKLDNLIQIAHNVHIGEHTAIAGCVGIAGSARIGRRCMIGGAAGILGHLEICDDVTISAMTLVASSITQPGFYSGVFPLMDHADWERAAVLLRRLPDLRSRLRRLESQFKES